MTQKGVVCVFFLDRKAFNLLAGYDFGLLKVFIVMISAMQTTLL